MKKNNLILGAFLAITAILFSGCGASSSSESAESDGLVTIGSQVWTSKNLDVATYRNGDVIPEVQDEHEWGDLTTGAWCYYDNDAANGTKYGKLYNWYAVHDRRGLAPKGFHIPTDEEWTKLQDYLSEGSENVFGGSDGTKMKSTSGWSNNGNGTNSSGFSGLPCGFRIENGKFPKNVSFGYWWSSTERKTNQSWTRYLNDKNGSLIRSYLMEKTGVSVRCIRD